VGRWMSTTHKTESRLPTFVGPRAVMKVLLKEVMEVET
jgi:hypothetical protein